MIQALGPWRYAGRTWRLKWFADQGVTTVHGADRTSVLYRGAWSIPRRLKRQGWLHIGDPDSSAGYLFDAYQGHPTEKMYEVTTPAGEHFQYLHPLETGELFNNSYAAVSPDGQWMVSGEWGVMSRLLMFATPILNPATPQAGGTLPLTGTILLDRRVRNVQGATFVDAGRLLCSTDDPNTDLWPTSRQLLQIDLEGPLTGHTTNARVTSLGQLPIQSRCPGSVEVEGLDYDVTTGDLRIDIVLPSLCGPLSAIYRFRQT